MENTIPLVAMMDIEPTSQHRYQKFVDMTPKQRRNVQYSYETCIELFRIKLARKGDSVDLFKRFVAIYVLPHIAFWLHLQDQADSLNVRIQPHERAVIARCIYGRSKLTKSEAATEYSTMSCKDLLALAVTRVQAVLKWAGAVVDRHQGDPIVYPHFATTDRRMQLEQCLGLIRFIRGRFATSRSEEDWPCAEIQICVERYRQQEKAVDFTQTILNNKRVKAGSLVPRELGTEDVEPDERDSDDHIDGE